METSNLNMVIVIIAVVCTLSFIVSFSLTRWEKTAEGRNFMILPFSILFLGISSISRRLDIFNSFTEDALSILAWIIISAMMIQRTHFVISTKKKYQEEEQWQE